MKVLLNSFDLNGHTLGINPQTETSAKPWSIIHELSVSIKELFNLKYSLVNEKFLWNVISNCYLDKSASVVLKRTQKHCLLSYFNNNLTLYLCVDSQHYKSYKGENHMHVDERLVWHQCFVVFGRKLSDP